MFPTATAQIPLHCFSLHKKDRHTALYTASEENEIHKMIKSVRFSLQFRLWNPGTLILFSKQIISPWWNYVEESEFQRILLFVCQISVGVCTRYHIYHYIVYFLVLRNTSQNFPRWWRWWRRCWWWWCRRLHAVCRRIYSTSFLLLVELVK